MTTPQTTIRRDTRVFISAASRELGSVRKLVKKGLEDNDYHAIEQDNFPPDYRQLIDKLRERIASCDAVIHIAGHCYGAEPKQRPDGAPRRSYTQLEYDLAVELGKPVYVFLTGDGFPADPHEREDEERTRLQAEHRQRLISTGQDYSRAATHEELDQKIRSLQLKCEVPLKELTRVDAQVAATGKRNTIVAAVVIVLVIAGSGIVTYQQELAREDVARLKRQTAEEAARLKQQQEEQATLTRELPKQIKQELTDPAALAETIRKSIHATVESKINELCDENGRWRKEEEIKKERDLALGRVDDLIKLIQEGLKEGASPVFQRATEILPKEGTDEVLAYLEASRPSTLEMVRRQNEQIKSSQARLAAETDERNKTLKVLKLEAELLETKLQWNPAVQLREQVAELAPDWFDAWNGLGVLHLALSQYAKAEPQFRKAVELASERSQEATALNNYSLLLHDTNRLTEAEPLIRRAIAIAEQFEGPTSLVFASRLNNLALLLSDTNRSEIAEPLLRHTLTIEQQSTQPSYRNIAYYLNSLAKVMLDTNRLAEAEPLLRHSLKINEQFCRTDDALSAAILNHMAILLKRTNRLMESEPLARRALAIDQQMYGPDHSNVAVHFHNFSILLYATNRESEAECLMRQALVVNERTFGPENLLVATNLNDFARILQATHRLAEAERLMRQCVSIFHQFGQKTGQKLPETKAVLVNYSSILQAMRLPEVELAQRVKEATADVGRLSPVIPEIERLLGPAKPVSEVLAALDLKYKTDGKPAVYFLSTKEPIAPHLDELLRPNPDSLNSTGVNAFRKGDYVDAIVCFDESLKLLVGKPDDVVTAFTTRMNRAAALRELGEMEQARDELRKLLSGLNDGDMIPTSSKGRAHYHLALCEWRLNDREVAQREAEESLKVYGDDADAAPQKTQTEQLLADLKENKLLPPLAKVDAVTALEQARVRFRARAELATLPLDQSALPLLDKMLGPAKSTKDVFDELDRQYREQGKPAIWFLPLTEPISPHLDELLGPVTTSEQSPGPIP